MNVVTRDCPIACLAPLLTQLTFDALACGLADSATVGDLAWLCAHRRLMELYGIGPSRAGEIRECLVGAGLVDLDTQLMWRDPQRQRAANGHHVSCSVQAG